MQKCLPLPWNQFLKNSHVSILLIILHGTLNILMVKQSSKTVFSRVPQIVLWVQLFSQLLLKTHATVTDMYVNTWVSLYFEGLINFRLETCQHIFFFHCKNLTPGVLPQLKCAEWLNQKIYSSNSRMCGIDSVINWDSAMIFLYKLSQIVI